MRTTRFAIVIPEFTTLFSATYDQVQEQKTIKMNNQFELKRWGVEEMSPAEMQQVEGGILPLLIVGAAVLLGSCGNTVIYNGGGTNQNNTSSSSSTSLDSSFNGSGSGNRFP